MTERDAILAQFLAEHDPPARDPRFIAAAVARLNRRNVWVEAMPLGAACVALASVLALVGPAMLAPLAVFTPVAAPIVIVGSVLFVMRGRFRAMLAS